MTKWVRVSGNADLTWRELPKSIVADTVPAIGFWLVVSPILVEGVHMVFAEIFRRRTRERGRQEGRTESDAAWRAWFMRRLDAEAAGEPFDEPPPDFRRERNGSSRLS